MAVIYFIPDEALKDYFSILNEYKTKGDMIVVGCKSNLSPVLRTHLWIKNKLIRLGFIRNPVLAIEVKQTGWIRHTKFLTKKIPKYLTVINIFNTHHYDNNYPNLLNLISQFIYPLTNSGYLIILK